MLFFSKNSNYPTKKYTWSQERCVQARIRGDSFGTDLHGFKDRGDGSRDSLGTSDHGPVPAIVLSQETYPGSSQQDSGEKAAFALFMDVSNDSAEKWTFTKG